MSYNLNNIRQIPGDSLTKFTNELSRRLSRFLTRDQVDQLEDREDIYIDGQDFDSVVRVHDDLGATTKFNFDTEYYPPTEPDGNHLRLWIRGTNLGNTIKDWSEFDNVPELLGDPILVDGAPFDDGIKTNGVKSIALRFNRPSKQVHDEFITIPDDNDVEVSEGLATGISFFIRFRVFSLDEHDGKEITLFEKFDNSDISDGVEIRISSGGRLKFHVTNGGDEFNVQTALGTIATDTVYDAWCTYDKSGDVQHIYVNNLDKSLTAADSPYWHTNTDDLNGTIFSLGTGLSAGNVYGDLYDFRIYREKVVSATEVSRMYTNKWTIANIPFGQVLIPNYWATYNESASLTSFMSTSFTNTSFTI